MKTLEFEMIKGSGHCSTSLGGKLVHFGCSHDVRYPIFP